MAVHERYIPQNLSMNESVPVCQSWSYASAHPMKAMLTKDYFLSAFDRLRPGDTVRIVQLRDANIHARDNQVIAYVDAVVLASSRKEVSLHLGSIVDLKTLALPQKVVRWNPGKKKHEVWLGEKLVFSTEDKSLADGWEPSDDDDED